MTDIEWCQNEDGTKGKTWNPIRGCSRVSPGCDHCYAMHFAHRFSGEGGVYEGLTVLRPKDAKRPGVDWAGSARFVPEMLGAPLKWRKPQRVFVNSMSDLFHESLKLEEIAEVFGVMAVAAQPFGGQYKVGHGWTNRFGPHTFQVLTKRAKRAREVLLSPRFRQLVAAAAYRHAMDRVDAGWLQQCVSGVREWGNHCTLDAMWPLPNVWIGVSAENQATADERIPLLLELPAAIRFVSAEPLLSDLTIWAYLKGETRDKCLTTLGGSPLPGLDWVIVGGESGNGARPFDAWWAVELIEQCKAAGVACFVKQLGAKPLFPVTDAEASNYGERLPLKLSDKKGGDMAEWVERLRVRQFPEVRRG